MAAPLPTEFAPAERDSADQIADQIVEFARQHDGGMVDATPNIFVVLNDKRQIIYANKALHDFIREADPERPIYGQRPGEILDCVHAAETEGGCGTSQFCVNCGSVKAILTGLSGRVATEECRILLESGDALDLRVWSTPLVHGETRYVMFAIQDISHEKRRRILERIFFHDLLNTAGVLFSSADLLVTEQVTLDDVADVFYRASRRLIDEIESQQILMAAESGELNAHIETVAPFKLMDEVAWLSRQYATARHIDVHLEADDPAFEFPTDRVLLTRVLANMTKNALEASDGGDQVTLVFHTNQDSITFAVHNPQYMPHNVQLQVFQRSFSTKGEGRGLGTYSVKLLTERYLRGRVWFETDEQAGTTFKVSLPLDGTAVQSP
jgi:signal transduction histidine kinase